MSTPRDLEEQKDDSVTFTTKRILLRTVDSTCDTLAVPPSHSSVSHDQSDKDTTADSTSTSADDLFPAKAKSTFVRFKFEDEATRCAEEKPKEDKHRYEAKINGNLQSFKSLATTISGLLLDEQELEIDRKIAVRVTMQTECEKQITKKLYDIRQRSAQIVANRQTVTKLVQQINNDDFVRKQNSSIANVTKLTMQIEAECDRSIELQNRTREFDAMQQMLQNMTVALDSLEDIVEIAIETSEFRRYNDNVVPDMAGSAWLALFRKGNVPLRKDELSEFARIENEQRQKTITDEDVTNYLDLLLPWSTLIPKIPEEVEYRLHQGFLLLGHIVNRIFEATDQTYKHSEDRSCPVQNDYLPIVVIGAPEQFTQCELRAMLKEKNIDVIVVQNAVDFCLQVFCDEYTSHTNNKTSNEVSETSSTSTDAPFSDTALLGRLAHELLKFGRPINSNLTAAIVAQYLKSIHAEDKTGWILANYPSNPEELRSLELAMSGERAYLDRTMKAPIVHRSQLPEESSNTFSIYKTPTERLASSRILPKPRDLAAVGHGYVTESWAPARFVAAFIKLVPVVHGLKEEPTLDRNIPIDKFYDELGIARVLTYDESEMSIITNHLVRIITEEVPILVSLPLEPKVIESAASSKGSLSTQKAEAEEQKYDQRFDFGSFPDTSVLTNWSSFPLPFPRANILKSFWSQIENMYINSLTDVLRIKRIHFSHVIPRRRSVLQLMTVFTQRPDNKQKLLDEFQRSFDDVNPNFREDMEVKYEFHCRIADFRAELRTITERRKNEAQVEQRRIVMDQWTTMEMVVLINVYLTMFQIEADRCIDIIQLISNYYALAGPNPVLGKRFKKLKIPKLDKDLASSKENEEFGGGEDAKSVAQSDKTSKSLLRATRSGKLRVTIGEGKIQLSSKISVLDYASTEFDYEAFNAEITKVITDPKGETFDVTKLSCYRLIRKTIQAVESHVSSVLLSITQNVNKESHDTKDKKQTGKGPPEMQQELHFATKSEANRMKFRLAILESGMCSDMRFLLKAMQRMVYFMSKLIYERYDEEMKSIDEMVSVVRLAIENGLPIDYHLILDGDQFYVKCKSGAKESCKVSRIGQMNYSMDSPISSLLQLHPMQLSKIVDVLTLIAPNGELSERQFTFILQDMISCGEDIISDVNPDMMLTVLPALWVNLKPNQLSTLNFKIFGDVDYVNWREFVISALCQDVISMPNQKEILTSLAKFRSLDPKSLELVPFKQFFTAISSCTFMNVSPQKLRKLYTNMQDLKSRLDRRTFESEIDILNTQFEKLLFSAFKISANSLNYTMFLLAVCKDTDPRIGFGKALTLMMGNPVCMIGQPECERYVQYLLQKRLKEMKAEEDADTEEDTGSTANNSDHQLKLVNSTASGYARFAKSPSVRIENLDGPSGRTVSVRDILTDAMDLPMSDSFMDSSTTLFSTDLADQSIENSSKMLKKSEGPIEKKCEGPRDMNFEESSMIHWIPLDICQMTLMAVLSPSRTIRPGDSRSISNILAAKLRQVYEDLKRPDLQDRENVVLSHELLNHPYIKQLLSLTNKFTETSLTALLEQILNEEITNLFSLKQSFIE